MYNLCYVINKNYIGVFKVSILSLLKNNKEKYLIHMLSNDLDEFDKLNLSNFLKEFNTEIKYYQIDDNIFKNLPKMGYDNSYTAYYKVLIPYILKDLDNCLYLDCDIIVKNGLKEIFELNHNHFLSASSDLRLNKKRKEHKKLIIGDDTITYFNSGVMYFDYKYKDEIPDINKLLDYLVSNKEDIIFHDQDILNHFFAKNYDLLDEKYNYATTYKDISDMLLKKGLKKAVVIHFANWKPWNEDYIGKAYRLYKKYYKMLKYDKDVSFLKKRKLIKMIKKILKYLR